MNSTVENNKMIPSNELESQSSLGIILVVVFLVPFSILWGIEMYFSLAWKMQHDFPLLHYVGYLINEHHLVPYKDIFETSMPGTFLFHMAIGKLFGYGDFPVRIVDIALLFGISTVTVLILKPFGKVVAWAGVLLFGLAYFELGPEMNLQRDYLGILPIAIAVFLTINTPFNKYFIDDWLIGFLFGCAATIKPHLAIGFPVLFYIRCLDSKRYTGIFTASILGLLLPIFGCFLWLLKIGAVNDFWDMLINYLPLHLGLSGEFQTIFGRDRMIYLINSWFYFGGYSIWFIPAISAILGARFLFKLSSPQKRIIRLISIMTVFYAAYPIFGGKFWSYHWFPFLYFIFLLGSLNFYEFKAGKMNLLLVVIIIFTMICDLKPPADFFRQINGLSPLPPKNGRVDEIAMFLTSHLRAGDKVQPLDWTGGAVHAMLQARSTAATPFIYDYHFYHHISDSYIHELRRRFIEMLGKSSPRFIIEVLTNKPWVWGPDTLMRFDELGRLLFNDYHIVYKGDGFVIHEKK